MNREGKSSFSIYFCIEDKNSQYGPFTLNTECLSPLDICASIKAGSWSSVNASVHICCFIITPNPLDLNNNRNWTEPGSPHSNCEATSSLPRMLFKFMFLLTAYLPHYIYSMNWRTAIYILTTFWSTIIIICMSSVQVCGHLVQEAEVRVWPAQSQPQDCLQRELQVRGPGEVSSQPGSHHAAAGRGVLEVTHIFNRFFPWYDGKGLEIEFCNVAWQKYESVTVSYSFHLWVKLSKELWNEWMWNIFTILLFFRIDKFFLISFPILFFIFNIIYWLAFIL